MTSLCKHDFAKMPPKLPRYSFKPKNWLARQGNPNDFNIASKCSSVQLCKQSNWIHRQIPDYWSNNGNQYTLFFDGCIADSCLLCCIWLNYLSLTNSTQRFYILNIVHVWNISLHCMHAPNRLSWHRTFLPSQHAWNSCLRQPALHNCDIWSISHSYCWLRTASNNRKHETMEKVLQENCTLLIYWAGYGSAILFEYRLNPICNTEY